MPGDYEPKPSESPESVRKYTPHARVSLKKVLKFCNIFFVLNTQIKIRTQISELPLVTFKLLLWAPELRLSEKGLFF